MEMFCEELFFLVLVGFKTKRGLRSSGGGGRANVRLKFMLKIPYMTSKM